MQDLLYSPSDQARSSSQLAEFSSIISEHSGLSFSSYQALQAWSVSNLETFWRLFWGYADLQGEPGNTVLQSKQMPGAQWFPEANLNFTENLLARGRDEDTALICCSESRPEQRYSYRELRQTVVRLSGYLWHQVGIRPGDRVAGYIGNTPEAVIMMLAAARIGAVWSAVSLDFGLDGALDRLGQVEPKVVLVGNGYRYAGKGFSRADTVAQLQAAMPDVKAWVAADTLDESVEPKASLADCLEWEVLISQPWPEVAAERFGFDHPLYILFSSGTTGQPKCIVHGAGGTLIQHAKEMLLHADVRRDSTLFYFTTTSWMMWNWVVSGLFTGAAVVLYEGSPTYPDERMLWRMAQRLGITHFGTSAKYLSACRKANLAFAPDALPALRVILSTGSPLSPDDFDWVYAQAKGDVLLQSISGGTDIVSCFVGGNPWSPVKRGRIQGANLGMDVQAWDEQGRPVRNQRGEMVCTQPTPSMPLYFMNDPDGSRYRSAYFERYPGVWSQGDFIEFDQDGQAVIHGRSDTTLNPGGVRIGTAEIYRVVESFPELLDSLVVGRPVEDDISIVLFVKLPPGQLLDDALKQSLKRKIREKNTPRHVPGEIIQVPDIPYTHSGKKVELAVSQILRGESPGNRSSLANPSCLDFYRELKEFKHE